MNKSELSRPLGSRSRASEILKGERKLSNGMIKKRNEKLGVSAQTLIQYYELVNGQEYRCFCHFTESKSTKFITFQVLDSYSKAANHFRSFITKQKSKLIKKGSDQFKINL
jgi:hypothetical protein